MLRFTLACRLNNYVHMYIIYTYIYVLHFVLCSSFYSHVLFFTSFQLCWIFIAIKLFSSSCKSLRFKRNKKKDLFFFFLFVWIFKTSEQFFLFQSSLYCSLLLLYCLNDFMFLLYNANTNANANANIYLNSQIHI